MCKSSYDCLCDTASCFAKNRPPGLASVDREVAQMTMQRRLVAMLLAVFSALAIAATAIRLTNPRTRQNDSAIARNAIDDLDRIRIGLQSGRVESLLELASELRANFRFPGNLRRLAREFVPELEYVPDSKLSEWIENHSSKLDFQHESQKFRLKEK